MVRISIKPLSINECWQGRRFKTTKYFSYREILFYLLPKIKIPSGKLKISITIGFSNKNADIDNPIKPFLDALQDKYGFNDKRIYKLEIEKVDVKKGSEYIDFDIKAF